MIENQEQLVHSHKQLAKLRAMEERVINNPDRHPRLKKSELAGIRSTIAQIEREIRVYNLSRLQNTIVELEKQVQQTNAEQLPALISRTIPVMRELANALQPVI
jgi:hypothetical protein